MLWGHFQEVNSSFRDSKIWNASYFVIDVQFYELLELCYEGDSAKKVLDRLVNIINADNEIINGNNDIISPTFRTSVRFLKRNNDDNKRVNGT